MPRFPLQEAEATFFRGLNAFVEPLVMRGCASPGLFPTGLVVLETRGRKTGETRRTPLSAAVVDGHVILSTYRGRRSEWVKNALADPSVRYWLGGREHSGRAFVLAPGANDAGLGGLPDLARALVEGPLRAATTMGWAFAIIRPDA
jgi:deazaflavin-dependent oxidoreductase (nitroreductase family)